MPERNRFFYGRCSLRMKRMLTMWSRWQNKIPWVVVLGSAASKQTHLSASSQTVRGQKLCKDNVPSLLYVPCLLVPAHVHAVNTCTQGLTQCYTSYENSKEACVTQCVLSHSLSQLFQLARLSWFSRAAAQCLCRNSVGNICRLCLMFIVHCLTKPIRYLFSPPCVPHLSCFNWLPFLPCLSVKSVKVLIHMKNKKPF